MDLATYAAEAEVEATHWWFVGRRRLFARELARLGLSPSARVLDVGTSTGTNLRMLRDLGFRTVTGLDSSPEARRYCAEKGLGDVRPGDVCDLPFADGSFDLVLATDIIEHVHDHARAVRELARVVAPGGRILFTVPAFQSLWGLQDEVSHHKRRYRYAEFMALLDEGGLRVRRAYYFNVLLFGPIWLARRLIALLGPKLESENQLNGRLLNRVLTLVFEIDCRLAPILRAPFGVSLLAVAGRAEDGG